MSEREREGGGERERAFTILSRNNGANVGSMEAKQRPRMAATHYL